MKQFFIYAVCLLGISSPAVCQSLITPQQGMQHMVVGDTPPSVPSSPPKETSPEKTPEDLDKEEQDRKEKRLSLIDSLVKDKTKKDLPYFAPQDDLKQWPYLRSLLSSDPEQQKKAIKKLEDNPHIASPMVLLLATEYFLKQKDKEKAALYLYATQLRVAFDMRRWPIINESGIKARHKDHPAQETLNLSKTIAHGLYGWVFTKKERAMKIMQSVQKWDKATRYAYLPFYELPSTTETERWDDLVQETRAEFFEAQEEIISALHPE